MQLPQHHPSVSSAGIGGHEERRPPELLEAVFKWVSLKELVFVFVACNVMAALLHDKDRLEFKPVWNQSLSANSYQNKKFPLQREKIPLPVVTDLDSDGVIDVLMVTPDGKLQCHIMRSGPRYLGTGLLDNNKVIQISLSDYNDVSRPVALATGFIDQYQSMVQIRKQIVVVLFADWTVLCFDENLNLLWKRRPENTTMISSEAAILVSPVQVQGKSDRGSVIVGGRVDSNIKQEEDSFTKKRRGERLHNEEDTLQSLVHYSTFTLTGQSGKTLWSHKRGDFEVTQAYSLESSSFRHIKLFLHTGQGHVGEVSWHQYSTAVQTVLPHSWSTDSDTIIDLAHFRKNRKRTDQPAMTEHISKVGDLAIDHLAGYAFGGMRPHSPVEHIESPNVVLIHSMKALLNFCKEAVNIFSPGFVADCTIRLVIVILSPDWFSTFKPKEVPVDTHPGSSITCTGLEVLHFQNGRPLFTLPLSPSHASHADIDSDGVIESVHAVVSPGDEGDYSSPECYGQAVTLSTVAKHIFSHSICEATHWTEMFIATDKWLPNLSKLGRKKVNHAITEPLSPVLVKSSSHQHPLKLSQVHSNLSFNLQQGVVYDSVFVLSSGRVTSIGPHGQFNWQVDTPADWDEMTDTIYSPDQDPQSFSAVFARESFTPSALPYPLKMFGPKTHVLIVGHSMASILSLADGSAAAEMVLPCPPIDRPVLADFTGDGVTDFMLICANKVVGFSPVHHSGFLQTTFLSMFVGLVIVVVAVYTRQRTGLLMPREKLAQD